MKKINLVPITIVAILAACASAPLKNDRLEQARAQVQTLSQDPLAAQAASQELQAARVELQKADALAADRGPQDEITHRAYLAQRHAEAGQARVDEARSKQQVAQGEADRNRVLLEARTREAEAAKAAAQMNMQAADAARQDAMAARADAETMAQQLAELQAEQTKRGMVMTLSDVLFDTGAATLKPGADLALNRLADFMKDNPGMRILVEGHTDSQGDEAYNEELSRRRSASVADALATRGITADRVSTVGRGEAYPVASNDSSAGRQQNRRVEIVFSDEAGRFARGVSEGTLR